MLQLIKTDQIHFTKDNPRRHDKNKPEMKSLMASIKTVGILQPPALRANAKGYEVIYGNRRVMAAKKLGFKEIMCDIKEMTDHEVFFAATTENVVRLEMEPMDQFEAFKKMIDNDSSIAAVASTFGVTELLVKRRMTLANLHPTIKKAFSAGEIDFDDLTAYTLGTPKQQLKLYNDGIKSEWMITRAMKKGKVPLSNAWFDISEYTGPITVDLFDSEDETAGYAMDAEKFYNLQIAAVHNQIDTDIKDGWMFSVLENQNGYDTKKIDDKPVERRYIGHNDTTKKDRKNYGISYFVDPRTCEVEAIHGWQFKPTKKVKSKDDEKTDAKANHTQRQHMMLAGAYQQLYLNKATLTDALRLYLLHTGAATDHKRTGAAQPKDLNDPFILNVSRYTNKSHIDVFLADMTKKNKWNLRDVWTPDEEFLKPYNQETLIGIAMKIGTNLDGRSKKTEKVKAIVKTFKENGAKAHAWMPFSE